MISISQAKRGTTEMDCYCKTLTFCLLTVKQDAMLPSMAWNGLPLLLTWPDESMDCQPTKNLPKHYQTIEQSK